MLCFVTVPSRLSHQLLGYVQDQQAIRAVDFHPNEHVLAVGSNSATLRLCSLHTLVQQADNGLQALPGGLDEAKPLTVLSQEKGYHKYDHCYAG